MPTTEISLTQTKRALWLGLKFSDIVEIGLKAAEQQLIENIENELAKKLAAKIETALADGQKSFDVTIYAKQGQYLATLSTPVKLDFHQNGFELADGIGIAFGLDNNDYSQEAIDREDIKTLCLSRICDMADELIVW